MLAQIVHKFGSSQRCYSMGEFNDNCIFDISVSAGQSNFFFQGSQTAQVDLWSDNPECVWLECHKYRTALKLLGLMADCLHQALVSFMDTIKVTNGDGYWFVSGERR